MEEKTFCVKSIMDAEVFTDFARFNSYRLDNRWLALAAFPAFMLALAAVNLITGSALFFWLCLASGIVLPALYILYFEKSVKNQIKLNKLDSPRLVYTVTLSAEKIHVDNGSEQADVKWDTLYRAYRNAGYIYVYALKNRAFILPVSAMAEGEADGIWRLCLNNAKEGRCKRLK